MNRKTAIDTIRSIWSQLDQEFCVTDKDRANSELGMEECLLALGVSEEEIRGELLIPSVEELEKEKNDMKIKKRYL